MSFSDGPYPFLSFPPDRPYFLAAHSSSNATPFTFLRIFLSGSFFLFAYLHYFQSNRVIELEKARIATQAEFNVIVDRIRLMSNVQRRETRLATETFEVIASYFKEADHLAEEIGGKLEAVHSRIEVLEMDKMCSEDRRLMSEGQTQKQLDEMKHIIKKNERAFQKDQDESRLNYDRLAVKLQGEMKDRTEAANNRAEDMEKGMVMMLQESAAARLKEYKEYLASYGAAVTTSEARESRLLDEIEEREKGYLRFRVEMMEANERCYQQGTEKLRADYRMELKQIAENTKCYQDDMERLKVDHRVELEQMKNDNIKREAKHAEQSSQMRFDVDHKHQALLLSITEAITKDKDRQTKEKERDEQAAVIVKQTERALLSSNINRLTTSIVELKSKSLAQLMEQWKWKAEIQDRLTLLSEDVGECQRGLDLVRKTRRQDAGIGGRKCGTEILKPAVPRNGPPPSPLQGLLTPAPSQSPPPRGLTAEVPLEQSICVSSRQPTSEVRVKQEETFIEIEHTEAYQFLETQAMGLGTPNNHVLPEFSLDQSFSLSGVQCADELLFTSLPCWPDTSSSGSPRNDDVFCKGRILENDSFALSRSSFEHSEGLRDVSPPQWPQSESPNITSDTRYFSIESLSLSRIALSSQEYITDVSPPDQWSESDDHDNAKFCRGRYLPNDSTALAQPTLSHGHLREVSPHRSQVGSASETDSREADFNANRLHSNGSLLLSTNKAGIKIKRLSPTPSPTKFAMSAGDFDGSTSFRPVRASSPSVPRTLRITTTFDGDSFTHAHTAFIPTSSSWLGCHPVIASARGGPTERNPTKQEGINCKPDSKFIWKTKCFIPETLNRPSMSAHVPEITRKHADLLANSPSPSSTQGNWNREVAPVGKKGSLRSQRRQSDGHEPRVSNSRRYKARHQSLPAFESDIFNPSK